jgi:hypothetical protein
MEKRQRVGLIAAIAVAAILVGTWFLSDRPPENLADFFSVPNSECVLLRDDGSTNWPRLTVLPILKRSSENPYRKTQFGFYQRLIFGDTLDYTMKKSESRCRFEVISGVSPTVPLGDYRVFVKSSKGSLLLPLEKIGDKVVSKNFVTLAEPGGLKLPGLDELPISEGMEWQLWQRKSLSAKK